MKRNEESFVRPWKISEGRVDRELAPRPQKAQKEHIRGEEKKKL